jgi:hypothetical protein
VVDGGVGVGVGVGWSSWVGGCGGFSGPGGKGRTGGRLTFGGGVVVCAGWVGCLDRGGCKGEREDSKSRDRNERGWFADDGREPVGVGDEISEEGGGFVDLSLLFKRAVFSFLFFLFSFFLFFFVGFFFFFFFFFFFRSSSGVSREMSAVGSGNAAADCCRRRCDVC